jgi:hypothetical protein
MNSSVDRLIKNYLNARKSFEAWCFMSGLDNHLNLINQEIREKVDKNPLLFHLRFLAMKDFSIELYKILKNSQRNEDNIYDLLEKRIKSNPKNLSELEIVHKKLRDEEVVIKDLCDIRDKFYAHLDKNFEKYLSTRSNIVDIQNLFSIIEEIIILLTSYEELMLNLKAIESREDYFL